MIQYEEYQWQGLEALIRQMACSLLVENKEIHNKEATQEYEMACEIAEIHEGVPYFSHSLLIWPDPDDEFMITTSCTCSREDCPHVHYGILQYQMMLEDNDTNVSFLEKIPDLNKLYDMLFPFMIFADEENLDEDIQLMFDEMENEIYVYLENEKAYTAFLYILFVAMLFIYENLIDTALFPLKIGQRLVDMLLDVADKLNPLEARQLTYLLMDYVIIPEIKNGLSLFSFFIAQFMGINMNDEMVDLYIGILEDYLGVDSDDLYEDSALPEHSFAFFLMYITFESGGVDPEDLADFCAGNYILPGARIFLADSAYRHGDMQAYQQILEDSKLFDKDEDIMEDFSDKLLEFYQDNHMDVQYEDELKWQLLEITQINLDKVNLLKEVMEEKSWKKFLKKLLQEQTCEPIRYRLACMAQDEKILKELIIVTNAQDMAAQILYIMFYDKKLAACMMEYLLNTAMKQARTPKEYREAIETAGFFMSEEKMEKQAAALLETWKQQYPRRSRMIRMIEAFDLDIFTRQKKPLIDPRNYPA